VLPFIKAPAAPTLRRVGNDRSGVMELEVRGGLTVGESNVISDLLSTQDSAMVAGAKLADAIAAEEKISITEAFQIIEDTAAGRTLEPTADLIRLRHASRIQEIVRLFRSSSRRSAEATVTALIRSRCNLPTWSVSDTCDLDEALFNDIWQLALDEQEAEDMPSTPPSEDDLKKQPPEQRPQPKRTGAKSSGN
jgi:hypothetical protein